MKLSVKQQRRNFIGISLLLFLLLSPFLTGAQIDQPDRYEIVQKNSDDYFTVISLKEQGLALIREKDKFLGNKKIWEVITLDTDLRQKSSLELEVNQRHGLLGYEVAEDELFLLFRAGETTKNSLEMIEISTAEGRELARFEINPELDFKVTHFSRVGQNIILGGYVNNEPAVLLYTPANNSIKVLPGFFQKDNELVDLRVNENGTFNAVLIDRSMRAERKLVFQTFDQTGKLLLEDVVPIDEDKSLQTSLTSTLQRDELVLLGTWGEKQGKQSLGFFSLAVDPFNEQDINYYYFGTLQHFLDYVSPKRAKRISESTTDALSDGRTPSFTSYAMPFRILETQRGFVMLAEVYNPSGTANPYYNSPYGPPFYGNPYYYYNPFWPGYYPGMRMYRPYSYGDPTRNADNVKYYETVAVAFGPEGKIMWDQSVVLDEMKRRALEQVSDFYTDDTNLYFLYKKESELKIKTISLADGSPSERTEKIRLNNPEEEIRSEKDLEDGLRHWTGNSFYTWGYQTIRNPGSKENRIRDVFYINKIVVN